MRLWPKSSKRKLWASLWVCMAIRGGLLCTWCKSLADQDGQSEDIEEWLWNLLEACISSSGVYFTLKRTYITHDFCITSSTVFVCWSKIPVKSAYELQAHTWIKQMLRMVKVWINNSRVICDTIFFLLVCCGLHLYSETGLACEEGLCATCKCVGVLACAMILWFLTRLTELFSSFSYGYPVRIMCSNVE